MERISKRVQQLPTEEFMGREEIEALPLHQLKVRGDSHAQRMEVRDMPNLLFLTLHANSGSSNTSKFAMPSSNIVRKKPAKCVIHGFVEYLGK